MIIYYSKHSLKKKPATNILHAIEHFRTHSQPTRSIRAAFSTRLWFGTVRMLPKPFAIGLSPEYLYAFKMGRAAVRTLGDLLGEGGDQADPFLRNESYALPTYARDPARYVRQGYDGMEAALTAIAAAANSAVGTWGQLYSEGNSTPRRRK